LLDSVSDGNLVFVDKDKPILLLVAPDIVEYDKINKPQYDLILGVKTIKKYCIILNFKDKMITVDEVKLSIQNINYLQGSSTLCALNVNHSLAMEPQSTQDETKHVTRILDAKYQKADLQQLSETIASI
jgi:hypothetical protein